MGFTVQGASVVEPGTPSLQEAVTSCTWRMEVIGADPGVVAAAVEQLLHRDQLVVTRERKGRDVTEDLRPALLELALQGPTPSGTELVAELATQPRALRPGDLLGVLAELVPGAAPGDAVLAALPGCAGPTNGWWSRANAASPSPRRLAHRSHRRSRSCVRRERSHRCPTNPPLPAPPPARPPTPRHRG